MLKQPTSLSFNTLEIIYNKPAETFLKNYEHFMNQRNKEKMVKMEEEDDAAIGDEAANHAAPVTEKEEEVSTAGKGSSQVGEVDLLGEDGAASAQGTKKVASSNGSAALNEEDLGKL